MGTTITEDTDNHVEVVEHAPEDQTDEGPEAQDFPPLFEDESEALTEEQLTGDEEALESEEEAASPPPEGDEKPPEEKASEEGDDTPPGDKPPEDKPPEDEAKEDGKPPEGYVPLAALHEERGKRQYLSTELETLKAEIKELKDVPQAPKEGEFKVLSDKEFQDLLDEDPTEAILYDRRLRVHETGLSQKAEAQRADQAIIDQSARLMREAIPQIYDSNSTINNDLSKFAVEQGFDEQYLPVLTDPRTKVIPPGSNEPVLLGDVAVGQVKMLYNLYQQKSNSGDRAAIDKEIEVAVAKDRKETTDRVTKQIVAKFKATPTQDYHSIGDIPGGGDEPFDVSKTLTAAQVDKLSETQKRQYLGG